MKISFLTPVLVLALAFSAYAGANPKYVVPLINPDSLYGNATWNNSEVEASYQLFKCRARISIKAHGSTALRGKDIVCMNNGNSYTSFGPTNNGSSTVYRGTIDATSGKMVARADERAIGCGLTTSAITTDFGVKCYEDTGWNAALRCTASGGLWILSNLLPNTSQYNAGAMVGLCEGNAPGFELTPPSGSDTVLAEDGYPTTCKKC